MPKLLSIFFISFLVQFYSLADCPNTRDLWLSYRNALKKSDSQNELIRLKIAAKKCQLQDSTYTLILQKIAENYLIKQDLINAEVAIKEAIEINSSPRQNIKKIYLVDNYSLWAKVSDRRGSYQTALSLYDRCIAWAMTFRAKAIGIPHIYSQKANILSKMGDFEKAVFQATIGVQIAQQQNTSLKEQKHSLLLVIYQKQKTT
jgi:tetratricopeptide (TPR) repeat protein